MRTKLLKNLGFQPSIITSDNYILGGLGIFDKKILNIDRDWTPYLPSGERQKRMIETNSCTQFGWLNAIETFEKFKTGKDKNYSERLVAIGSENSPAGNDPHVVAEWIRKNGLVDEAYLAFDDSIKTREEYMSPNPLPCSLRRKAKQWKKSFDFKHEWVFHNKLPLKKKQEQLLEALNYSPVCVSVTAWKKRDGLYYKNSNDQDNHWTLMTKGRRNKPWLIFDSYLDDEAYLKELSWDYDFSFAKLFSLEVLKRSFFGNWLDTILA